VAGRRAKWSKKLAREVYEDFLHRRQDPALLEKALGNEFSARVFPIAANEEKQLILAYSEELLGAKPYRVALAGTPTLDRLTVDVSAHGSRPAHIKFERKAMAPTEDLVLHGASDEANSALRNGDLAVIRIHPRLELEPVPLGNTIVMFDTSASRAPGFPRQLVLLEQIARRIGQQPDATLTVAAFDQTQELIFRGKGAGFDHHHIEQILRRAAMGATDVYGAIAWVKQEARLQSAKRLIIVTDGITTMHDTESDPILPMVRALRDIGIERLDVVLSGGIRDSDAARSWTTQLPIFGVVLDAELPFAAIERQLTHAASGKLPVDVEGATWFWPTELDGIDDGGESLVYAEVAQNRALALRVGNQAIKLRTSQIGERALLERAWARAKIANLEEQRRRDHDNPELVRQMVELSQRFRVISPVTSLLVLESAADYDRFGVKRDPNLLQIKEGQVIAAAAQNEDVRAASAPSTTVVPQRSAAKSSPPEAQAFGAIGLLEAGASVNVAPTANTEPLGGGAALSGDARARAALWGDSIGDAFGAGGLGLTGIGEGKAEGKGLGSIGTLGHGAPATSGTVVAPSSGNRRSGGPGSGSGRLSGSHRTRAPIVRAGATTVSGTLAPEVVRRIVRQSHGRFRMCYEQGLQQNPNLDGVVQVRFVIGRTGQVMNAQNGGSTLPNATVVSCVISAFYGVEFPAPESGIVTVQYPIIFEPGSGVRPLANKPFARSSQPEEYDQPWDGKFAEVMAEITAKRFELASARAEQWRDERPNDVLAWVALGRAYRAQGELDRAGRAFGSIIDLWGFRADLRRYVASELEALDRANYLAIATDSYRHALADRPDHPSSHLWLAIALMKQGDLVAAMKILEIGYRRDFDPRYRAARRIFGELIEMCAAAEMRKDPEHATLIQKRVEEFGLTVGTAPSARLLLSWESDANDVDFHVFDQIGTLAYFGAPVLPDRGGELYADVTDGYGPECFAIDAPRKRGDRRYSLFAHYFRRGPMGAGLGKLEIVEHDGKGELSFDTRPYVVTRDGSRVPLGDVSFERKLAAK
jgi:tetratricopeptide (TPR) repeat protein